MYCDVLVILWLDIDVGSIVIGLLVLAGSAAIICRLMGFLFFPVDPLKNAILQLRRGRHRFRECGNLHTLFHSSYLTVEFRIEPTHILQLLYLYIGSKPKYIALYDAALYVMIEFQLIL